MVYWPNISNAKIIVSKTTLHNNTIYILRLEDIKDLRKCLLKSGYVAIVYRSLNIDEIEDEYHVLMNCSRYIRQRRNLVNRISSIIDLDLFSLTELFNLILQCKEYAYIKLVYKTCIAIVKIMGNF